MNVFDCVNIVYLNVCGLKTRLCFPEFLHFISQYDILCFVETKLDDIDKIDIPGYTLYTNNRKLKSFVKSGGICLAVKDSLITQVHIHKNMSDYVLWFSLKEPVSSKSKYTIVIGIVYIPPESSPYFNKDTFTILQDEINNLSTEKNILLLGDFNARTQSLPDYVIGDTEVNSSVELSNELLDYMNEPNKLLNIGIPLERANQDKCKPNSHGYKLIELCKNNNLYILNGRVCDDKHVGKTTCKGTSVIDYAISSFYVLHIF